MADLRQSLETALRGRVCLMGLGNVDHGDDGFGVRLAEALANGAPQPSVLIAGTVPERFLGPVAKEGYDHLVFLDAVEFGGAPGAVVFLSADEIGSRCPQISTHKLSLGLLAKMVAADSHTAVWLLGVQPQSLRPGAGLSAPLQATLEALRGLLKELWSTS